MSNCGQEHEHLRHWSQSKRQLTQEKGTTVIHQHICRRHEGPLSRGPKDHLNTRIPDPEAWLRGGDFRNIPCFVGPMASTARPSYQLRRWSVSRVPQTSSSLCGPLKNAASAAFLVSFPNCAPSSWPNCWGSGRALGKNVRGGCLSLCCM